MLGAWLAVPSVWSAALFAIGWACGWFLLWRPRPLPAASAAPRGPVAIVIPARNEEATLPALLGSVVPQCRSGDEIVVVDDASTDATAAVARRAGATVVRAPPLPDGWTGKCWACATGAASTTAGTLVFLDADVVLAPATLERLVAMVDRDPAALVSVQPWHTTRRAYEQLSLLPNIAALMGSGACTPLGARVAAPVAFGPVLASSRTAYDSAGGHADPGVRGAVAEDIALARRYPRREVFAGRRTGATFRMYPNGGRALVEGWTKNIATGAGSIRPWAFVGVAGWLWSLSGGALSSVWLGVASVLQVLVLGRRAGRFGVLAALTAPLAVWPFLLLFARSALLTALRREVRWRGRRVRTR